MFKSYFKWYYGKYETFYNNHERNIVFLSHELRRSKVILAFQKFDFHNMELDSYYA